MRHLQALLGVLLLRAASACTTTSFNSTYNNYPDCAASCLACTDSSYSRNFANNCDFESGDCCTSKYHTVIAETWSCVGTNCGDKVSQEAFSTFVQFCKDEKHELQEADVPQGYSLTETEDTSKKKPVLSTGQIVGISIGGVTCVATIIGLILRWRHYRRKKNLPAGTPSEANSNMQLIHQVQPMEVGAVAHAFRGNGDVSLTYTRNTSTVSLTHGRVKTTEKYEITRNRGEMNFRRVEDIEEVD